MNNVTSTIPNVVILSSWENVKRALEAAVRGNGCGVVKITVLFNERGIPVQHTKPQVTRLEPRGTGSAVMDWLEELG